MILGNYFNIEEMFSFDSVSNRKVAHRRTNDLPFDCWVNIIYFLSDQKDFVSLTLTVKGLLQYIRRTGAQACTINIDFKLFQIPGMPQDQVTSLVCGEFKENYTNKLNSLLPPNERRKLNVLVQRIMKRMRRVKRLKIDLFQYEFLKSRFSMKDKSEIDGELFSLNQDSSYSPDISISLTSLSIFLTNCPLTVNYHFQNLRELVLFRTGPLSSGERRGRGNLPSDMLSIEWSCFPNLTSLSLAGWRMKSSLSPLKDRLTKLSLYRVLTCEKELTNFRSLEHLTINNESTTNFTKLSDVKKLRHLEITNLLTFLSFQVPVDQRLRRDWKFSFPICHFESLTTLIITNRAGVTAFPSNPPILIHSLPNLSRLEVIGYRFPLHLQNTPQLSIIKSVHTSSKIDFLSEGKDGKELRKLHFVGSQIGENILRRLSTFGKLEEIEVRNFSFSHSFFVEGVKLDGLENLTSFKTDGNNMSVAMIRDCPRLVELECQPEQNIIISGSSFSEKNWLKNMKLKGSKMGPPPNYDIIRLELNPILSQIDERVESIDELDFSTFDGGGNNLILLHQHPIRKVKSLKVRSSQGKVEFEGGQEAGGPPFALTKLDIRSTQTRISRLCNLEEVICVCRDDSFIIEDDEDVKDYRKRFVFHECPSLTSVTIRLESYGLTRGSIEDHESEERIPHVIFESENNSVEKLTIIGIFPSRNIRFPSSPNNIKTLHLKMTTCIGAYDDDFDVTDRLFPNLEHLIVEIHNRGSYSPLGPDDIRLGRISNLKRLKLISIGIRDGLDFLRRRHEVSSSLLRDEGNISSVLKMTNPIADEIEGMGDDSKVLVEVFRVDVLGERKEDGEEDDQERERITLRDYKKIMDNIL